MSLRCKVLCGFYELFTSVFQQPECNVCGNSGTVSAQKLPYRLAEVLSFYVPEGDVHRADSGGPGTGLRTRIEPVKEIIPVTLCRQRVFADE